MPKHDGTLYSQWLSITTVGDEDQKPLTYTSEASFILFFAQDTGNLYIAARPALPPDTLRVPETYGECVWRPFAKLGDETDREAYGDATPTFESLPTEDPKETGKVWNNDGVVFVSVNKDDL